MLLRKTFTTSFTALALCTLAACSSAPDKTTVDFEGRWIITEIAGKGSLAQHTPWLELSNGQMTGHSGCNRFFSEYQVKGNNIAFGPIGSTRKLCPGPEMKQESALLKLLTTPLEMKEGNENSLVLSLDDTAVLKLLADTELTESNK
jgi:heat shock protein HslJ